MPTICELTIELKKLGVSGYSGKRKATLEDMLAKAKSGSKSEGKKPQAQAGSSGSKAEGKKPAKSQAQAGSSSSSGSSRPAPTLAGRPMTELYQKIKSLEKRLKDNVNPNEKGVTERTLEKYKEAYRFQRREFIDSIKKMNQTQLKKKIRELERLIKGQTDEDVLTIIRGKLAELDKLVK